MPTRSQSVSRSISSYSSSTMMTSCSGGVRPAIKSRANWGNMTLFLCLLLGLLIGEINRILIVFLLPRRGEWSLSAMSLSSRIFSYTKTARTALSSLARTRSEIQARISNSIRKVEECHGATGETRIPGPPLRRQLGQWRSSCRRMRSNLCRANRTLGYFLSPPRSIMNSHL